jgi:hypothetical protein
MLILKINIGILSLIVVVTPGTLAASKEQDFFILYENMSSKHGLNIKY